MQFDRRQFVRQAGLGAAALAYSPWAVPAAEPAGFTLPKLPYAPDALEPYIDKLTMEIHHGKHHQAYVDNLNKALASQPELLKQPIETILRNIDKVKPEIKQAVINNGGGHANHSLFWEVMTPKGGGEPSGPLGKAITAEFGSFDKLQAAMSDAGVKQFGSGWSWLVLNQGKLQVLGAPNQDSPLMKGATPILGLDVWEHAYYLKYQNRRADYVKAWWNVVNWQAVADRYEKALKG
ncbi:MAG: superoxide dismutase [Planctomycetia bacterium]|nr:superoxide dismutase [Planctomycetia bacterium]